MQVTAMKIYNRGDQLRVFGLIGFEFVLRQASYEPVDSFRITVGAHSEIFERSKLTDFRPGCNRPESMLVFHVNTFRLQPGTVTIEVFANDGPLAGRRLASYDILVDNTGELAARTASALARANAPVLLPAMVDSSHFGDHEAADIVPWFDRPEAWSERATNWLAGFRASIEPGEPAATTEQALANLRKFGFCVLPERIPEELCDRLVKEAKGFVSGGGSHQDYEWGSSQRILNTHQLAAGREVWLFAPVLNFLSRWFRDQPVACQTLFYFFGSEQSAHQDTIHLTAFPAGYMCGVWVALEDVKLGSGELFVYPQSQGLQRLRSKGLQLDKVAKDYSPFKVFDESVGGLVRSNNLQRTPYLAKKGQILVWHENLIHGGEKRVNLKSSRLSIVSHYFARGSVAYYDARGEAAALQEIHNAPTSAAVESTTKGAVTA